MLVLYMFLFLAEVVELVDTLGSGSSGGYPVGVRVSPSAPFKKPLLLDVAGDFLDHKTASLFIRVPIKS